MQVVPWYLPFRFGREADVSPQLDFVGGRIPPGITNIIKQSYLCQFLIDSNDLYIYEPIQFMNLYNFSKIAAILNFHINVPPSWISCVFVPLKKKFYFTCITAQFLIQNMIPHTHRKRTYIEHNLVSLPII